ncbi:MAG: hypothetical protein IKD66_15700 [Solobacterium sp.]|nr:hypothetical protein [Solobacterium sp.]
MKRIQLRKLLYMAICCDLGIISKRLISPFANVLTDALHVPGGIGTSFSLMFLVIGAALTDTFGSGLLMGALQSGIALALGATGSLGALSPIAYMIPGIAIDLVFLLLRRAKKETAVMAACIIAPLTASLTANALIFQLKGVVLLLYAGIACSTGALCGLIAIPLIERLLPVVNAPSWHRKKAS